MKNKKLFDKTISILVNAYLKGTLIHGDSCACAVGNLIAGHNNYTMKCKGDKITDILWINQKDIKGWDITSPMPIMKRKYGKFKRKIYRQIIDKDKSPLTS